MSHLGEETKTELEEKDISKPKFICGIICYMTLDGNGIQFTVIESPDVIRRATLTDMNMMFNHLVDHTRAVMNATQTEELREKIQAQSMIKKLAQTKH